MIFIIPITVGANASSLDRELRVNYYHPKNFDVDKSGIALLIKRAVLNRDTAAKLEVIQHINIDDSYRENAYFLIQTAFAHINFTNQKKSLFQFFMEIVGNNSHFFDAWNSVVKYEDVYIYQNDSLIDEKRISLDLNQPHTSAYLMRNGFAPIGPDGSFLQICRLTNNYNEFWFELSAAMYENLKVKLAFQKDFQKECLEQKDLKKYWINRVSSF